MASLGRQYGGIKASGRFVCSAVGSELDSDEGPEDAVTGVHTALTSLSVTTTTTAQAL